MHRNLWRICVGQFIFQLPVMTDDVIAISGQCKWKFSVFDENGHVIPQNTPKTLLSSFLVLFDCSNIAEIYFSKYWYITKIHGENLMTSLWRNRMWPEVNKGTAQHKSFIDYDAKRIRSLSVTGFEKKNTKLTAT